MRGRQPSSIAVSLADVANQAGLDELPRLFHRRDSQGEFAAEPAEVSLLFVAQQRAISAASGADEVVRSHRVAGGIDTLVRRMAAEVDRSSHHRRDVARRRARRRRRSPSSHRADGCRPTTWCWRARWCRCATCSSIRRCPSQLRSAIDELGYGTVTKTAMQFAERQWPAGYATTEGVSQRIYEPTVDQPGPAGVLMSYAGGDGGRALAERPEAERMHVIESDMRDVHGIDAPATGGFSRAWSAEPRYGGSYAVYRPGPGHRVLGGAAPAARADLARGRACRDVDRLPRGSRRERRKSCRRDSCTRASLAVHAPK